MEIYEYGLSLLRTEDCLIKKFVFVADKAKTIAEAFEEMMKFLEKKGIVVDQNSYTEKNKSVYSTDGLSKYTIASEQTGKITDRNTGEIEIRYKPCSLARFIFTRYDSISTLYKDENEEIQDLTNALERVTSGHGVEIKGGEDALLNEIRINPSYVIDLYEYILMGYMQRNSQLYSTLLNREHILHSNLNEYDNKRLINLINKKSKDKRINPFTVASIVGSALFRNLFKYNNCVIDIQLSQRENNGGYRYNDEEINNTPQPIPNDEVVLKAYKKYVSDRKQQPFKFEHKVDAMPIVNLEEQERRILSALSEAFPQEVTKSTKKPNPYTQEYKRREFLPQMNAGTKYWTTSNIIFGTGDPIKKDK